MLDIFTMYQVLLGLGIFGLVISLYSQLGPERGLFFSTKRLGMVMKYLFYIIIFVAWINLFIEHNKAIDKLYKHNIPMKGYEQTYKDKKVEEFRSTLKD